MKKLVFFILFITSTGFAHAKDYKSIINEFSVGRIDNIGLIDFHLFHNDFIQEYSRYCKDYIKQYETRKILYKEVTSDNYGVVNETVIGVPTLVYIEHKYVEKFDEYFQANFQAEKLRALGGVFSKGPESFEDYQNTLQRRKNTLRVFLDGKCKTDKVLIVYENIYRASNSFAALKNVSVDESMLLYDFSGHRDTINSVVFSKNDKIIFSGSQGTRDNLSIWDITQGVRKQGLWAGYDVYSIAFDPTGTYLATGGNTGRLNLWFVDDMHELRQPDEGSPVRAPIVLSSSYCKQFYCSIRTISFSIDGKYVASGSDDGKIKVWDVKEKTLVRSIDAHGKNVLTVSFSPDSKKILSSGMGTDSSRSVKVWDIEDKSYFKTVIKMESKTGLYGRIVFSQDSRYFSVSYQSGLLEIRDTDKGEVVQTISNFSKGIGARAFSPNGKYLGLGFPDGSVKVWDVENRIIFASYKGHSKAVDAITFSHDGKLLATGSRDKTVKVWKLY